MSDETKPPDVKSPDQITVLNVTGDGKPHSFALDGDSEVAEAYRRHMAKPLIKASESGVLAEQIVQYLVVCREQNIAVDYSVKKFDLHAAATGALFFNHKSYEVVTQAGRNKIQGALTEADTRTLALALQACSMALATAPRVEKSSEVQTKVDLAALIQGLASKAKDPQELAASLLKLIK